MFNYKMIFSVVKNSTPDRFFINRFSPEQSFLRKNRIEYQLFLFFLLGVVTGRHEFVITAGPIAGAIITERGCQIRLILIQCNAIWRLKMQKIFVTAILGENLNY
jgi:hypothetical protein